MPEELSVPFSQIWREEDLVLPYVPLVFTPPPPNVSQHKSEKGHNTKLRYTRMVANCLTIPFYYHTLKISFVLLCLMSVLSMYLLIDHYHPLHFLLLWALHGFACCT